MLVCALEGLRQGEGVAWRLWEAHVCISVSLGSLGIQRGYVCFIGRGFEYRSRVVFAEGDFGTS